MENDDEDDDDDTQLGRSGEVDAHTQDGLGSRDTYLSTGQNQDGFYMPKIFHQ